MPYSLFYRRRPFRMISYAVSPYSEMARWVMDRLGVEYREESHVPMLHFLLVQKTDELPGLVVPEKMLGNAREVLDYWEARSPRAETLDAGDDPDVEALLERFYSKTGVAVRRFAYYYMLPDRRGTLKCWQRGAPLWEKVVSSVFFPIMRGIMNKGLQLTPTAPQESMVEIDDCFQLVEQHLADGRRYLTGDRLTAADIAFASLTAPVIFPDGYAGPLPRIEELPHAMREQVKRLRGTSAGQFALKLYREDRGTPSRGGIKTAGGIGAFFKRLVLVVTGSPHVLRFVFALLRHFRPVLVFGKSAVVSRHADVVDVLERDEDFTISEINQARMDRAHAPFILGWDRSPRYDREVGILRRAADDNDLATIRTVVAREAQQLIGVAEGRADRRREWADPGRSHPSRLRILRHSGSERANDDALAARPLLRDLPQPLRGPRGQPDCGGLRRSIKRLPRRADRPPQERVGRGRGRPRRHADPTDPAAVGARRLFRRRRHPAEHLGDHRRGSRHHLGGPGAGDQRDPRPASGASLGHGRPRRPGT